MDLGLDGHAYLLTGASRGLGLATAHLLVAEGARVVLTGREEGSLRDAAASLGSAGAYVVADNADPATPDRLVDVVHERFGRLDGALISVGGPPPGSVLETSDDDWASSFDTVFLGAVRVARAVSVDLRARRRPGSIAFVLSTSVREPVGGLALSNGLRPGLAMVAKMLAAEVGPDAIRVNGLLPGRIATDRVAQLDAATGDPEAARSAAVARIPLGRYGEPAEFAAAATFLLSPAASFVDGVMLPVDGGMLHGL